MATFETGQPDQGQIIAMGGGAGSDGDDLRLYRYILAQSGQANPAICFLPQASGESAEYVIRFYAAFSQLSCRPSHLSLFDPPTADLDSYLLENDVIFVGGGNTRSMLALWREWGLDQNPPPGLAAGDRAGRVERRVDLLVRVGGHRFDPRSADSAGLPGLFAGKQLSALRWRARASAGVPSAAGRGEPAGRVCRRRWRRPAFSRPPAGADYFGPSGWPGVSRRPGRWGGGGRAAGGRSFAGRLSGAARFS